MTGATELLHDTIESRLRAVEQRYTSGRRDLVVALEQASRPLSIPEVVAARPELPQSSVYRNLAVLETAGVVRRIQTADEFARYELTEDLTEHHHHLVCTSCASVLDYAPSARLERSMAQAMAEIEAETGFQLDTHRVDLVGLCGNCQ